MSFQIKINAKSGKDRKEEKGATVFIVVVIINNSLRQPPLPLPLIRLEMVINYFPPEASPVGSLYHTMLTWLGRDLNG